MSNVLITGCSSGIGLLTALRFARGGHRVFATMRNLEKGARLEQARKEEGLALTLLELDVRKDESVRRAVEQAQREAGPLDVLVNNAGYELRAPIEETDDEEALAQLDTNVLGVLRTLRAVTPAMRERRQGTIINVSSVAGFVSVPFAGFYAASKHALEALSEALHLELRPYGVRVVVVQPGQHQTQFLDNVQRGRRFNSASPYWERSEQFDTAIQRLLPDGQLANPQAVADAIYEVAQSDTPRLRQPVGDDAVMISQARRQMEFEEYEQMVLQSMDWR
jgi:NAD(P)-dependent dehydrogenase (short-subunit alcohol dehydrogenase family)